MPTPPVATTGLKLGVGRTGLIVGVFTPPVTTTGRLVRVGRTGTIVGVPTPPVASMEAGGATPVGMVFFRRSRHQYHVKHTQDDEGHERVGKAAKSVPYLTSSGAVGNKPTVAYLNLVSSPNSSCSSSWLLNPLPSRPSRPAYGKRVQ